MAKHRFDDGDDRVKWGGPALLRRRDHVPGTHGREGEDATAPELSPEPALEPVPC